VVVTVRAWHLGAPLGCDLAFLALDAIFVAVGVALMRSNRVRVAGVPIAR
jgi:hypothetical protein